MPSIVSFHRNVGHAVILIILFSFFYLATPVCRFIHLLSETTLYAKMRKISREKFKLFVKKIRLFVRESPQKGIPVLLYRKDGQRS